MSGGIPAARRPGFPLSRRHSLGVRLPLALVLALVGVTLLRGLGLGSVQPTSPLGWDYRGFNLPVWSVDGFYDSGPALRQLADTGANSVTFVVTWYALNRYSPDIARTEQTASDESLIWAIEQARSLGLRVMLKPHLDTRDHVWRAYINPSDAELWFRNYAELLDHYADMARQHGAAALCVGTELITLSTNPANEGHWRQLIAGVRVRFGGALTYSANWGGGYGASEDFAGEYARIPFWDALDYLGLSAYFEVADTATPTVAGMEARWGEWRATAIAPFQARWNKPVLFTEGGYRSVDGAASHPWDAAAPGLPDVQEQADCWEALFRSWRGVPWLAGGLFWAWSIQDIPAQDTGYEVQNKPAYQVVATWFGGKGERP
jgi:hypothetical protein